MGHTLTGQLTEQQQKQAALRMALDDLGGAYERVDPISLLTIIDVMKSVRIVLEIYEDTKEEQPFTRKKSYAEYAAGHF